MAAPSAIRKETLKEDNACVFPESIEFGEVEAQDTQFFKVLGLLGRLDTLQIPYEPEYVEVEPVKDDDNNEQQAACSSEPIEAAQELTYTNCSFYNTSVFLDEVIPPTDNNKEIMTQIVSILNLDDVIDINGSFGWQYSLLTIFTKMCNSIVNANVADTRAFYPFTARSYALLSGFEDKNIKNTESVFVDAILTCMDDHTRRYRNKSTLTSALIIMIFYHLFELKPAGIWMEPLPTIIEGMKKVQGSVWCAHSSVALQRIIFGNAGELSPYLWYEVLLCKTFGEHARNQCRVFKYMCTAGYSMIQAMFDTLCSDVIFVSVSQPTYIKEILIPWILNMPPFWKKSWKRVVFYDAPWRYHETWFHNNHMELLFDILPEGCSTECYVECAGEYLKFDPKSMKKEEERIARQKEKRAREFESLPKFTSIEPNSQSPPPYKSKLRRRQ